MLVYCHSWGCPRSFRRLRKPRRSALLYRIRAPVADIVGLVNQLAPGAFQALISHPVVDTQFALSVAGYHVVAHIASTIGGATGPQAASGARAPLLPAARRARAAEWRSATGCGAARRVPRHVVHRTHIAQVAYRMVVGAATRLRVHYLHAHQRRGRRLLQRPRSFAATAPRGLLAIFRAAVASGAGVSAAAVGCSVDAAATSASGALSSRRERPSGRGLLFLEAARRGFAAPAPSPLR